MALPQVGQVFGRYRIDDVIGRGGMGVVLLATDTSLGRRVALKVVASDLGGDEEFRVRFEREAATLARLASSHVITIYDYGTEDDCPYIATQYVGGGDLGAFLHERGPMAPGAALRTCAQVADALDDAHRAGIVHRDVKPTNVLVRDRDDPEVHVFLCDFGIARTGTDGLTTPGAVAGTWSYLSPENGRGAPASESSDLYALGCVLWAALTGRPPYTGTDVAIAMSHQRDPVPQLPGDSPAVQAVNALLVRALAKDPADRYPDARSLRDAMLAAADLPGADTVVPVPHADPTPTPHTSSRSLPPAGPPSSTDATMPPPSYQSLSQPSSSPLGPPAAPAEAPGRRTPRGLVAAGIVLVLLAAAGTTYALTSGGGDDDPGPTPTSTGTDGSATSDRPITGDLDGDGFGDLSVDYDPLGGTALQTTTWRSDGEGAFIDPTTTELGPRKGEATWRVRGQLDDDGVSDVLTLSQPGAQGLVQVDSALSGGDTVDGELSGDTGPAYNNQALQDYDADGIDELVSLVPDGDSTFVVSTRAFDGTGFGDEEERLRLDATGVNAIWIGDVDGDQRFDVMTVTVANDIDGTLDLRLNDGKGGFDEPLNASFFGSSSRILLRSADLDGDGAEEVVVGQLDDGFIQLTVFDFEDGGLNANPNAGSIRYADARIGPTLTAVDVNGDHNDDLVSVGPATEGGKGRALVAISNGSTFTSRRWLEWDQRFVESNGDDAGRFEALDVARW